MEASPWSWKKGQSGNPGGFTSATRKAQIKSAEVAAKASLKTLQAFERLQKVATDQEILNMLTSERLSLIKDAQDRGEGKAVNRTELTSPDGSMSPSAQSSAAEQLAQFLDKRGEASKSDPE